MGFSGVSEPELEWTEEQFPGQHEPVDVLSGQNIGPVPDGSWLTTCARLFMLTNMPQNQNRDCNLAIMSLITLLRAISRVSGLHDWHWSFLKSVP